MYKKLVLSFTAATVFFASCKKDPVDPVNPSTPLEIPYENLTTTTNYFTTFLGDDGNTSVDFAGQTTRIAMLKELDAHMKSWTTGTVDANKLKNMFAHTNSPFASADLNAATDKTLISKTAASFAVVDAETERNRFKDYFDAQAATSAFRLDSAYQGHAGKLGTYLVNDKGFEYAQFVQKGLIGALLLDQIANIYLGNEKMAADNSTIVSGKNYTVLEHHWDEAYGYLTSNEYFPKKDPNDATKWLEAFLGSYVRQVGNPSDVYMAFLKGRAAIVNKDEATRTTQIAFIRTSLENAIASIAISYLNKTNDATNAAARFHALSEGIGFLYSLRYAHNAKVNATKSNQLMDQLMNKPNGFWSLTTADIDAVRDELATAFGIDKETYVNH
ncbi:MAG: DUF4856 domain-containing protein [Flavipsychrobacter sp.]|nr:DUF4856 domain-containing protein [Flavipsychrobacter sp.]